MKPPWRRVKVDWHDAYSIEEWTAAAEMAVQSHLCETSGYLIAESNHYIVIAATVAPNGEGWDVSNIMAIPRGCIVKPARLRVS